MHPVHRLFFGLLIGITAALPACSRGGAQGTSAGSSQQAVPVTVDQVVEKEMPLDVNVVGTVEAFSTVAVRAQVTGELKDVNFTQGDDVQAGQVLFALGSSAARSGAEPGRSEPRARYGAGGEREGDCPENGRPRRTRSRDTRAARYRPRHRRRARRRGWRGQGRRRKRESAAAIRHHSCANRRTDGRAHGPRGQPRARQRSDGARRHQSGQPDLRLVRRSRGAAARAAALHGAAGARGRGGSPERRNRPRDRPHYVRRQPGRSDHRHDSNQGHVPERESPALAWPVRQRAGAGSPPIRARLWCRRSPCRQVPRDSSSTL